MSARNKPDNLEQPVVYKCEDCSKPTHTCACGHCHNHIWRCLRCGRKLCAECDFTFDGLCGECYRKPEQELTYRQLAFDSYHANHRLLRNLIEIRERHGISQAELAERMNIPVQTIIGIENGSLEFLPYLTDYALEVGALAEYKITPYDITITEGERE